MHFSKTYAQLLLSLPPDLRDNAIQYRQLKKLINQIVHELSSLGLSPTVLHELFEAPPPNSLPFPPESSSPDKGKGKARADPPENYGHTTTYTAQTSNGTAHPRVVYEFNAEQDRIEPRLRLWVDGTDWLEGLKVPLYEAKVVEEGEEDESEEGGEEGVGGASELIKKMSLSEGSSLVVEEATSVDPVDHPPASSPTILSPSPFPGPTTPTPPRPTITSTPPSPHSPPTPPPPPPSHPHELIIPLPSDTRFFALLSTALAASSSHLSTLHTDFTHTLTQLARTIGDSARPASASSSSGVLGLRNLGRGVKPHSSVSTHAGAIRLGNVGMSKSDLYTWRALFQLYTDTQIFESITESSRGERTVDEASSRLALFVRQVRAQGLDGKLRGRGSREALETFLKMNMFILDVKKFSLANSEATRKILKKHTKRTSLPLSPFPTTQNAPSLLPLTLPSTSLPRLLVQALGTALLPVIPHIDDYACLICTGIAFKPIRLNCGHLFCVRCLVKMQKRGNGDCPMCRSPCVLVANRTNVDWALLNFMQDWFPIESREKLKQNEKEASDEQLRELGIDPDQSCVVM